VEGNFHKFYFAFQKRISTDPKKVIVKKPYRSGSAFV